MNQAYRVGESVLEDLKASKGQQEGRPALERLLAALFAR